MHVFHQLRAGFATAAFLAVASVPANATTILDASNDFVATYTGAYFASLDVTQFSVEYDGSVFHLAATMVGPILSTDPDLYTIGIYLGRPSPNSVASIGLPNIFFNSVATLTGAGLTGGVAFTGSATISGDSFTLDIPLNALPAAGQGLVPSQYGFNLWARNSNLPFNSGQITDFAPDTTNISVPEPVSISVLVAGLLGLWAARKCRAR